MSLLGDSIHFSYTELNIYWFLFPFKTPSKIYLFEAKNLLYQTYILTHHYWKNTAQARHRAWAWVTSSAKMQPQVLNKCVWPCGSIVWWSSHRDEARSLSAYQIICYKNKELNIMKYQHKNCLITICQTARTQRNVHT